MRLLTLVVDLVKGSKWNTQISSPVITVSRKFGSFCSICSIINIGEFLFVYGFSKVRRNTCEAKYGETVNFYAKCETSTFQNADWSLHLLICHSLISLQEYNGKEKTENHPSTKRELQETIISLKRWYTEEVLQNLVDSMAVVMEARAGPIKY